jgi:hypothetical protein
MSSSIHFESDYKKETVRDRSGKAEAITETLKQEITYNQLSLFRYKVGSLEEAPEYLRDNEYIEHGYRINFTTVKHVLKR